MEVIYLGEITFREVYFVSCLCCCDDRLLSFLHLKWWDAFCCFDGAVEFILIFSLILVWKLVRDCHCLWLLLEIIMCGVWTV